MCLTLVAAPTAVTVRKRLTGQKSAEVVVPTGIIRWVGKDRTSSGIKEPALLVLGWMGYFRLADTPRVFAGLDEWFRRRTRQVRWKEWKRPRSRHRMRLIVRAERPHPGAQLLALAGHDARRRWEPKRLRLCLFSTAARLVRIGRRQLLRFNRAWPWGELLVGALTRLRVLPTPGCPAVACTDEYEEVYPGACGSWRSTRAHRDTCMPTSGFSLFGQR